MYIFSAQVLADHIDQLDLALISLRRRTETLIGSP